MKTLACVTMAYNEAALLPLWLRHYGGQVGLENCYVIDQGSTDGSTAAMGGANRIHLPRTARDEVRRAAFLSEFCGALLHYHDCVLYTDADEFAVADPARWPGLVAYAQEAPPVTTCLGINLVHRFAHEPALDPGRPILAQRGYGFAISGMCKPVFIRRKVAWTAGIHSYDGPMAFGDLVLFHAAYADLDIALDRQAKRNGHLFPEGLTGHHHQEPPRRAYEWIAEWAALPCDDDVTLLADCPHRGGFIAEMEESARRYAGRGYGFDMLIWRNRLWRIPNRFRDAF